MVKKKVQEHFFGKVINERKLKDFSEHRAENILDFHPVNGKHGTMATLCDLHLSAARGSQSRCSIKDHNNMTGECI